MGEAFTDEPTNLYNVIMDIYAFLAELQQSTGGKMAVLKWPFQDDSPKKCTMIAMWREVVAIHPS